MLHIKDIEAFARINEALLREGSDAGSDSATVEEADNKRAAAAMLFMRLAGAALTKPPVWLPPGPAPKEEDAAPEARAVEQPADELPAEELPVPSAAPAMVAGPEAEAEILVEPAPPVEAVPEVASAPLLPVEPPATEPEAVVCAPVEDQTAADARRARFRVSAAPQPKIREKRRFKIAPKAETSPEPEPPPAGIQPDATAVLAAAQPPVPAAAPVAVTPAARPAAPRGVPGGVLGAFQRLFFGGR